MLKKFAIGLGAVLVLLVGVIATRPGTFTLSRSATVPGTPDVAFALVNDFHQWSQWSPWDKLDADLKRTYSGSESGPGAIYEWTGEKSGQGKMTIEETQANASIRIKLEFIKPFEATNSTVFTFQPAQDGTTVTWTMSGENNFMSKAFSLFFDMDSMVGKDFENGLANMKTAATNEVARRAEAETARKLAETKAAEEAAAATPTP
jgi:hypothetical protein